MQLTSKQRKVTEVQQLPRSVAVLGAHIRTLKWHLDVLLGKSTSEHLDFWHFHSTFIVVHCVEVRVVAGQKSSVTFQYEHFAPQGTGEEDARIKQTLLFLLVQCSRKQ